MYKAKDKKTVEGSYYTPNGYILAIVERESLPDYNNISTYSDLPFFMRRDQMARKAKAHLNPIHQDNQKQINEHIIYYLPHMDKVIILAQYEQYSMVAIHPDIILAIVPEEYIEKDSSESSVEIEEKSKKEMSN